MLRCSLSTTVHAHSSVVQLSKEDDHQVLSLFDEHSPTLRDLRGGSASIFPVNRIERFLGVFCELHLLGIFRPRISSKARDWDQCRVRPSERNAHRLLGINRTAKMAAEVERHWWVSSHHRLVPVKETFGPKSHYQSTLRMW